MNSQAPAVFDVRTPSGLLPVTLTLGAPIFIVGPNGTGKSALVLDISIQMGGKAEYIPGSRPVSFESESLQMTPASRAQFSQHKASWDQNPLMRWNPPQAAVRNEKAIHDIQLAEVQFKVEAADKIAIEGSASKAIDLLQAGNSPLNRLNRQLAAASLPIRLAVISGELRVKRDGATYSIARSSDGERSAIIIASVILSAVAGTTFILDEPELHLHRSIIVSLLAGLVKERSDCYFLISTHELDLPTSVENSTCIAVRGCTWLGEAVINWDVDLLPPSAHLPENLRVDVLGSRRRILFVEGTIDSLDRPMYALLFPNISVRNRGSCKEVRQAVLGLHGTLSEHMVRPFGLVDNDHMPQSEIDELRAESIFALTIFTVESLYYSLEVRTALAVRQAETLGLEVETLLSGAVTLAIAKLQNPDQITHLAARICERNLRGRVLSAIPDKETLVAGSAPTINLTFPSPYPAALAKLEALVASSNLDEIINRYPVRESGVLNAIAKALHFATRDDYERAALARVANDSELAAQLRAKLDLLSQAVLS